MDKNDVPMDEVNNYLTHSYVKRETLAYEKRTKPNYKVVEKLSSRQVVLQHVQSKKDILITVEESEEDGGSLLLSSEAIPVYQNLPDCLYPLLENYTSKELLSNPYKVLKSICRI